MWRAQHLGHPRQTKAIAAARMKTVAVDARTLAGLLRADLLPDAYIALRKLRRVRDCSVTNVGLTGFRRR